jgi:lysophospholipase L1-like esterase
MRGDGTLNFMKLALILSVGLNGVLACAVLLLANRMGYLGRLFVAFNLNNPAGLPTDTLASRPEWQNEVKSQLAIAQNQHYKVCLFGDSISSGLGYSLGEGSFNFAIAGMSSVSQLEQLKRLTTAGVKCEALLMALGTNDAAYRVTDGQFEKNMKAIVAQVRTQMGVKAVAMIPAFYSTVEASHDPSLAGPLHRVNRINGLIERIAAQEKTILMNDGLEGLFEGQALKQTLTTDGVHLNPDGVTIYRAALLKMMSRLEKGHFPTVTIS